MLFVAVIFTGVSLYGLRKTQQELEAVRQSYVLQERDFNSNGLPERFYDINGKKAFVSIDGETIDNLLRSDNYDSAAVYSLDSVKTASVSSQDKLKISPARH